MKAQSPWSVVLAVTLLGTTIPTDISQGQAPHDLPARAVVANRLLMENPPPLGVNTLGDMGGTSHARGNLIPDWGFEPIAMRYRYRVMESGEENGRPWVTLDGRGITRGDLVTTGFMSGADYRVYRIVDAAGDPVPLRSDVDYLDLSNAARYVRVDQGRVPAVGDPGFPNGGWIADRYGAPGLGSLTRSGTTFTDASWLENDQPAYYLVAAIDSTGEETYDFREPTTLVGAVEVSATPSSTATPGLFIVPGVSSGDNDVPPVATGAWFGYTPRAAGAQGPVTWELLDGDGQPLSPPFGLEFDSATGTLQGVATATPPPTPIRFRATADNGSATLAVVLNNPGWTGAPDGVRPAPPQNVVATPGDGFVHLSWDPSPSADVVGYRIYRSTVPLAQTRERVYLAEGAPVPRRWDYIHFDKRVLAPDPNWSHPRVRTGRITETWHQWSDGGNIDYERVRHPVPPPAAMRHPGESCMAITSSASFPETINGPTIFHAVTGDAESLWYGYLEPGVTYRFEAWMRHDGLTDATVRLGFWGQYEAIGQDFTLDGNWQLCRFEFVAPAVPTTGTHGGPAITFTGPGTVFMDSIRLVPVDLDTAGPGLEAPGARNFQALQEFNPPTGPKGVLRDLWVALVPNFMESLLSLQSEAGVAFDWYQGVGGRDSLPHLLQIALLTGSDRESRMKPWLTINSNASVEEWSMLMEYLTEPIDPSDAADVGAKPWAHLRYQQRGVPTPWVDEFPGIVIEFSNETWHNMSVEEQWSGWGRTFHVNDGGEEYGLYVRHILDGIGSTTPRLAQLRAEGRIAFQMGNSYWAYAQHGIVHAPDVEALGHATYIGPRWETGETPNAAFTDEGIQATLLAHAEGFANDLDGWRRERERMADEHGILYDFFAYEGGPSGYSLPGTVDAATVAIGEQYGKSLAMGTASLDAWLAAYEAGFREMAFYAFAARERWASHTELTRNYPQGYTPHTGWLAIQLRNRHARGDLIPIEFPQTPSIMRNGNALPLVSGYAFRDGARFAIFLLSRKLDGTHNGTDFGDGSTPVTLELPGNPNGPATLYSLTGDPRTNNISTQQIAIAQSSVNLSRETTISLPAGSVHLYVVDTDLDPNASPPPPVANLALTHETHRNLLTWDVVPEATSYRVRRSTNQYFSRSQEEDVFTVSHPTFEDPDGGGGTTFYYRVAAIGPWGEGLASRVNVGGTNPHAETLPAPVTAGAGVGDSRLILSWEAVPGATGYRVGYRPVTGGPYAWISPGNVTTYTLTGLRNGVSYQWTVQPVGADGRGRIAQASVATPLSASTLQSLAVWDFMGATSFESRRTPSSRSAVMAVTPLTRGAGFNPGAVEDDGTLSTDYHPLPNTFGFMPLGLYQDSNFGLDPGGGDLDLAIARDYYLEFSITPEPGAEASLAAVESGFVYPYSDAANLEVALRYRVGSGNWTTVPGTFTIPRQLWGPNGIPLGTETFFDLSGIAELQGVTETVAIRFYIYSRDANARYCRAGLDLWDSPDLLVRGTYTEQSTSARALFDSWRALYFSAADIAAGRAEPLANSPATGRPNWQDFLLRGRSPGGIHPGPLQEAFLDPAEGGAGTGVRAWIHRATPDNAWAVEASSDLVRWDGSLSRFSTRILASDGDYDFTEFLDLAPNPGRCFYRIRSENAHW